MAGDASYYPKLAKGREVALWPTPMRHGAPYPTVPLSLLPIEDVLNRDPRWVVCSVHLSRCGDPPQATCSYCFYCQQRRLRAEREKDKPEEPQRLLCSNQKKADGDRGAGSGALILSEPPPTDASGYRLEDQPPSPSDAELAAIYAARAKSRESG